MVEADLKLQLFFRRLKSAVRRPNGVLIVEREKNLEAMDRFDLDRTTVIRIVSCLKPEHYSSGPECDFDGSEGSIWIFSAPVTDKRFYIKLKLFSIDGLDYIKVLSFHD